MTIPITWKNVGENAGSPGLANSVGAGWQQVADGLMGFREQPREDRAEQRVMQQHNLDQALGGFNIAKGAFEVENQEREFESQMATRDMLRQKAASDLTESLYTQSVRQKTQETFDWMSSPEVRKQAWVPAKEKGESGHYDEDTAVALYLDKHPNVDPRIALAAAKLQNEIYGDPARDAAALRAEVQRNKMAVKKAGGAFNSSGINAQLENIDDYVWFSNDENRTSAQLAVNKAKLKGMKQDEIAARLAQATVSSWMGASEFDLKKFNAPLDPKK